MTPYPETYNPEGCDIFIWNIGEEIRGCGISSDGVKYMSRRVVPEQGYAIITEMPDQFIREADGFIIGVALPDEGRIGYIVPNLS